MVLKSHAHASMESGLREELKTPVRVQYHRDPLVAFGCSSQMMCSGSQRVPRRPLVRPLQPLGGVSSFFLGDSAAGVAYESVKEESLRSARRPDVVEVRCIVI